MQIFYIALMALSLAHNMQAAESLADQMGSAIFEKNPTQVQALIDKGADPNSSSYGIPLILAVSSKKPVDLEIVTILLAAKADPNRAQSDKFTPLMNASRYGYEKVVELLLQAKADPNIVSVAKKTALTYALETGYTSLIERLVKAGAHTTVNGIDLTKKYPQLTHMVQERNRKGMSIVASAQQRRHPLVSQLPNELVRMIEAYVETP